MIIETLGKHSELLDQIARLHFEQWGALTGTGSLAEYRAFLETACADTSLPVVVVAVADGKLLGSASVIECDLSIRNELTPWLAQVYVLDERRGQGVGTALVKAASEYAGKLGFQRLYLYTSGTLPRFYQRLGWANREKVSYLGKERTIMELSLFQERRQHGQGLHPE